MKKEDYFSDDCIVEDSLYKEIKSLLICPLCNKILKEPLMCSGCQNSYCLKCLENLSNITSCPNKCNKNKFSKSISKNELLSKIKYKCKNCKEDIFQINIPAHLESNCQPKIKELNKKSLIRLSPIEMKSIDKDNINHFTSKEIIINFNILNII